MPKNKPDEFYIGWMAKAPGRSAAFIKKYILMLLPVVIAAALVLALCQRKFGTGNFEFGTLTTVKGVYFDLPVPNIEVETGRDIWGKMGYITIPLIGYGKFGAEGVIADIEKTKGISLNGRTLTLRGTLLYNDDKIFMQVDGNDNPLTAIAQTAPSVTVMPKQLGVVTVKGEIVDPKCYFGVMKPGEGKPHKDCAIRCILGGMPPVLHVVDERGRCNYYFIVGPKGEKINKEIKDYMATPVEINADAVEYNDWVVLYLNGSHGIHALSKSEIYQPTGGLVACAAPACR